MQTFRVFVEITKSEIHDTVGKDEEDALEKIKKMFKDNLKAIKKIETIMPTKNKQNANLSEQRQLELFVINDDNIAIPTDPGQEFDSVFGEEEHGKL